MTELKTLKDMEISKERYQASQVAKGYSVCLRDIKTEAIKWVKGKNMKNCLYCESLFLEFHNITDEDLK